MITVTYEPDELRALLAHTIRSTRHSERWARMHEQALRSRFMRKCTRERHEEALARWILLANAERAMIRAVSRALTDAEKEATRDAE